MYSLYSRSVERAFIAAVDACKQREVGAGDA